MANEKVGFIGLGIMGKPMARNLMAAGHDVTVFNRSRGKVDELAGEGATAGESPRQVAETCDVIFTILPDSPQVREVMEGEDGVLAGASEGDLVVDMSTISPVVTRELAEEAAEHGVHLLDAPVSGGEPGAIAGKLSIMVGGSEEDFARAEPLFAAVSEGLVLASKAGVEPAKVLDAIAGGLAGSKVMETKRDKFLEHEFEPGFRVELHHKDTGIALATAREFGVALPLTAAVDQMFQVLRERGQGAEDHSALLTLVEDAAQHRIGESVAEVT